MVGAGSVVSPRFPGSDTLGGGVVPIFSAQRGGITVGVLPSSGIALGLSMDLVQDNTWRAGVAIGPGIGKARSANQSTRLQGWGDVSDASKLALYASYNQPGWGFNANAVTALSGDGDQNLGTKMALGVESRIRASERVFLSAGPALVWADARNTQTLYGITRAQAASSGLSAYEAGSGLQSLGMNFGANVQFTPQWGLLARAGVAQLQGSAAKSPLVERTRQVSLSAFAVYRF